MGPTICTRNHGWRAGLLGLLLLAIGCPAPAQVFRGIPRREPAAPPVQCSFRIAKLKYGGGGDWYANPTAGPNLLAFVRKETRLPVCPDEDAVEPGSAQLFNYQFAYLTGHGNIVFTAAERQNLRTWLQGGGFLLMDDNYGMNRYAVREIRALFPELPLKEVPHDHPIYRMQYAFPNGMPKVHEHDGKPAQALGIEYKGRLVLLLTFETDLGDGWEDAAVHNNSEATRTTALQMGTNLLLYAAMPLVP